MRIRKIKNQLQLPLSLPPKRQRPLTSLLISSCLSGAERAVALIMVDVWLSVNFLIQRWPATMLQTYRTSIKQNQSEKLHEKYRGGEIKYNDHI